MSAPRPPSAPAPVPLAQLRNPYRRKLVVPRKMAELRASILKQGLLEPLRVSARMNVISGTCRYDVLTELGHAEAPCVVHGDVADDTAELVFLDAFDTKSDRHLVDRAFTALDYQQRHGLTWGQVAQALGYSAGTASRYKAVTALPQPVVDALRREAIGLTHAMELKHAPEARQLELLREAVERGLSPKDIRALVRGRRARKKAVEVAVGKLRLTIPPDTSLAELHDLLKSVLAAAIAKGQSLSLGVTELQKLVNAVRP